MDQLPKLKPTVGGGLGGLPERVAGGEVRGEVSFFSAGEYTWTVPSGVTSICIVCLGAGGGGASNDSFDAGGGGGGALAWVNDVKVSAGDVLTANVGAGGRADIFSSNATSGGESKITAESIICHAGGGGGSIRTNLTTTTVGAVIVGSGGSGGTGIYKTLSANTAASGGGAGGYSGNGGDGSTATTTVSGSAGAGGGGASGSIANGSSSSSGGGVSLFGEGDNGVGVATSSSSLTRNGSNLPFDYSTQITDSYAYPPINGAGGGAVAKSTNAKSMSAAGGHGAVRILWGKGRAFPSTDVGQS